MLDALMLLIWIGHKYVLEQERKKERKKKEKRCEIN
jgi:hypothetical protein